MMADSENVFEINRVEYENSMGENLPVLRAKLNLSQTELANKIGVTRQTISAIESKSRQMSWSIFLSLLFLFSQNSQTKELLTLFGIYTPELTKFLSLASLDKLREEAGE